MKDKTKLDFILSEVKALKEAPSCYPGLKDIAAKWEAALGTDGEAAAAKDFVSEMEECLTPIDGLIAFAESENGRSYFGADTAAALASHGKEIKAKGALYCDCGACAACEKLLKEKDTILAV